MRTLIKVGVSMLLLGLVLIGLSYSMLRAEGISNPASAAGRAVRAEKREIGKGISSVDLSGPIDLTLSQGATPSMRVRGEQRLLANIDTTQDGETLHIGTKGMLFHHRHPLQVELVLPSLQQLDVHGSGDSSVNGFSGERFRLQLNGSGNVTFNGRFKNIVGGLHGSGDLNLNGGNSDKVELEIIGSGQITSSGSTRSLEAQMTGSGDLDAEHLAADKVTMSLQGSGTANVFAKEAAELTLRGSGDIQIHGNPSQRSVSRSGSGEVKWD
ncbi:MAG TPA: head GIN domain-containing protein [Janthinobacterium sp.]|nr:head GIN domain-containing protein [Janthinobacterium sp.]